jgi:eukaryotic-like serine/threonine-protein kinase
MTSVPVQSDRPSRNYGAGTIIADKYELVRPLGEGGMGTVWVARNIALQSHVALKLLRADVTDEDASERLLQEARVAARLDHSAIVRVFDFGQTPHGEPFIVMDLVDGETLAALLAARGRLAPVKAVQILLPVLDALATAHAHGIVHRDLKPENILLDREAGRTQPKIVDFGIAKADRGITSETLTRRGAALGSPGYMAPEQARGSSTTDARADVWAICVVLYECITGRPAFEGENYNALMRAIVEDDLVPITEVAAGDSELWTILQRGLQKDPAARWLSALELGRALAEWLMRHEVDVDISGDRLSAWIQPDSSKPRDLLSAPPPPLGVSESGRRTVAAAVQANRPRPFRTATLFIATIALLILGATAAITVIRRQPSTIGSSPSPLLDTTAPRAFEPTVAMTSAPSAPASAIVPVEAPDQTSADESTKPKPTPRAVPVPKKPKPSASKAAQSDLKNPY